MAGASLTVPEILGDAQWLAHRYDDTQDSFHFRRVPREMHRKATFLTDEYLGEEPNPIVIRRIDAVAALPDPAPVHFIFHSAFCCSTLVARAFDIPGKSMGLKEPMVLNDIVGWHLRGAERDDIGRTLDRSLALLARPFETGEAIIVKPSNLLNPFAPAMMRMRPQAKALLLNAPLSVFLRSVARKEMWGRLWVRDLLVKLLRQRFVDLGFEQFDYLGMTDLQAAAVGWLAQQALFERMAEHFENRVLTLNSETLLEKPRDAVMSLAALYEIELDGDAIDAVLSGPAFATNSKTGDAYTVEERTAGYENAARHHADEIEKVLVWAEAVTKNAGLTIGDVSR